MNRRHLLATGTALAFYASIAKAQTPEGKVSILKGRIREQLDKGWKFAFGHLNNSEKDFDWGKDLRTYAKQGPDASSAAKLNFDDANWRQVQLPHDWAVELPFVQNPKASELKPDDYGAVWDPMANHGFKPIGRDYPETSVGWYRKVINLDKGDEEKRISFEFDGVFRQAFVIFNGYIIKNHDGGYTPFSVDVTDFINTDDSPNILLVRVDASLGEGWFYEGAGLYRDVWLVKTNKIYVPQYGLCVRPSNDGKIEAIISIRNDNDKSQNVTVSTNVGGSKSISSINVLAFSEVEVTQTLQIENPHLWSVEDPFLYQIEVNLFSDAGTYLDGYGANFGFRNVVFDAESGFYLNGKSMKLKGTCNHQDHAGIGAAIPKAVDRYRLQLLKDMGCNAVRTAHNPPSTQLLELCDEMGMLVIDETRMMTSSAKGLQQLSTMIKRDRNHPSIILWSIGNEEPQQGTKRGANIAKTMKRVCNQLDPTRKITAAMDSGYGDGITAVVDVIGFNYRDHLIDDFHNKFPNLPIIGTETASTVSTRGEYIKDDKRHIVPAYDTIAPWWATTAEGWWPHFNAKPFIGGGFIWTGFDYRGEPTPYSEWPSISSQFGVLDTCGFAKDAYFYYRSWWRKEPLLHLLPHWNWEGEEGNIIKVWAHSNLDEVELFLNGKSFGKKTVKKDFHVEWDVPYTSGKIEAYGWKNGKLILKDKRETALNASKIILSVDRKSLVGDGRDCAIIKAQIVDEKGRPNPKANNLIKFEIRGSAEIIGVGNGDPNCHEADKATKRSAYNGLCSAIIQAKDSGEIEIIASSEKLKSFNLKINAI